MSNTTPEIIVVGSHAPGMLIRVKDIPRAGETVIGWGFDEPQDGGKGSNQAIAAAKLGAKVSFVGCVGQDRIGKEGETWMCNAGVDTSWMLKLEGISSGIGFILLNEKGIPAMVTSMGANEKLNKEHIDLALEQMRGAKVLVTQFEIRPEVALYAARIARRNNILSIVNPAPACSIDLESLNVADILVPNEIEAKTLLGYGLEIPIDVNILAQDLRKKGKVNCVIITYGENGVIGVDNSGTWEVRPPQVNAVDTSGAGDAFCAALAVALSEGKNYREASDWACKVAAFSVTRFGTIASYPTKMEMEYFISHDQ
jgi:ribokinase